jgi:phage tail-like protein
MLSEREQPQRRLVRVPDVVGLPLRKALLLIQQSGLRVGAVLYKESYEEKETVLEQKPQRGQMVYASEDVTIWVSRESYIKWLPAIYQRSDATGRNVVRDLLWIIQHLFGSIEQVLDQVHLFFDSYETPESFLPWLASWSAMLLEPDWPVNKKRRLIKKAMELYRLRGTVRGLKLFISLFTGFEPHLAENEWPFQGFRIGTTSTVGIDTVILPPVDKAHAFVVVMPHQFREVTTEAIIRLHEIIEMEKPAHSAYMLKFEEPQQAVEERAFYRIGISSGVNIGQEIVTPLPINAETGEPELPKEQELPEPQPNPSVYELFGTKKRQLPPIVSAPKADNAPVEGKEVTSSKYGFEGAREFKLDDIMRELLARAGVPDSSGGGSSDGGSGGGSSDGGSGGGSSDGGSGASGAGSPSGSGGAAAANPGSEAASVASSGATASTMTIDAASSVVGRPAPSFGAAGKSTAVTGDKRAGRSPQIDVEIEQLQAGSGSSDDTGLRDAAWAELLSSGNESAAAAAVTTSTPVGTRTGKEPRIEVEVVKTEVEPGAGQSPDGNKNDLGK